jgi:predicted O-methyltransferase YrrM
VSDADISEYGFDTTVAHPARRYDYWLDGKDNFAADRESGDKIAAAFPSIRTAVRENRAYLKRTVSFLAREAGIRQFLDIGTGLPTADNTHEVAQAIAPDARIVYVDNDPIVLTHARALLTSTRDGATAYIDADVRDPARILADPQMHETLDLSKPVGLVLLAIMHFIDDTEDPHAIVAQLVSALAPGSYLVMSHATYDPMPPEIVTRLKAAIAGTGEKGGPRDREQFAKFFAGLDLVDPGVVPIGDWRPTPGTPVPDPADVGVYGAVARIP